jgi:predicted Rossmann-fold nucleotide-binding protein
MMVLKQPFIAQEFNIYEE